MQEGRANLSIWAEVLIFIACLASMLAASEVLVRGLTRFGVKLNLTEGLLGLLTALGADSPEIASAIASLAAGSADLGRGVVLGSNIFNLAMLLGLSAVVAGQVRARRQGVALDGTVALLTLLVVTALLLGLLGPLPAIILLIVLFTLYALLLGVRPRQVYSLPLPRNISHLLALAVSQIHHEKKDEAKEQGGRQPDKKKSWLPVLFVPLSLTVIVVASIWLVKAALALANAWQLPQAIVGAVILAGLTGLPNAYAAVRLSMHRRGAAVASETLNSNSINLVVGLTLPALLLGVSGIASHVIFELGWLWGMTVIGLVLLLTRGVTRLWGAGLLILYIAFVVIHILLPGM
jgi:cation:H+ antiporter